MSIIDKSAKNLISLAQRQINPVKFLDRQIVVEQHKLVAAALVLARKHFTDSPAPIWGSGAVVAQKVEPEPQPVAPRRNPTQKKFKKKRRRKCNFSSREIRRSGPSSQVTMMGYRDAHGGGSCYVMAPPKVAGHDGWSTGIIIKRKYHKVFDLK